MKNIKDDDFNKCLGKGIIFVNPENEIERKLNSINILEIKERKKLISEYKEKINNNKNR